MCSHVPVSESGKSVEVNARVDTSALACEA